jgi:hypothetical protein
LFAAASFAAESITSGVQPNKQTESARQIPLKKPTMATSRRPAADHIEANETRNMTVRRKNAYQPNARAANPLWKSRMTNERIISLAVRPDTVRPEIKEAAEKDYSEKEFKDIDQADKALWEEIATLVTKLEESFDHLSQA